MKTPKKITEESLKVDKYYCVPQGYGFVLARFDGIGHFIPNGERKYIFTHNGMRITLASLDGVFKAKMRSKYE